jgi:tRNA(Leu) C34 or U34 (ribose-2'-O)-methylase TrmL
MSPTDKSSIALCNPKSPTNLGAILRSAGCFGIENVYYSGTRIELAQKFHTDTHNAKDKIQLEKVDDLSSIAGQGLPLICIELTENAQPITEFAHPEHAIYLFGPEDGSIPQTLINQADSVLYIPTYECLNLAATVNITLYDRMQKLHNIAPSNALIRSARDQNNRTKKPL